MAQFDFYLNGVQVSEPVGFDQIKFNIIRSEEHGIDQVFTNEVTFTGDNDKQPGLANAAGILRLVFENEFINGSVEIEIVSDIKVDGSIWSFTGKIDFSTYEETNLCDGCSDGVSVSIIEDDFREQFRSRSDVEVDLLTSLSLDGDYISALSLDTIRLHSQELYLQAFGRNLLEKFVNAVIVEPVFPIYFDTSDFKGPFSGTFDVTGTFFSGTNVIFQNNANDARDIVFSGVVKATVKNNAPVNSFRAFVYIGLLNASGVPTGTFYTVFTTPFIGPGSTYFIDTTFTDVMPFSIPPGFRVSYSLEYEINPFGYDITFLVGNTITLTELNSSAASTCQGLYIFEYLRRIIEILTGDADGLRSDYFSIAENGCQWNNLLTTGLYIRNGQLADGANPQIKTTFKRTFENLARIFCLGWEFEPDEYNGYKIRIEPVEYFYQPDLILDFTNVAEIKRNALTDKLVNSVTHGYTDQWKNIQVSGIFAIHTERNYFIANKAMDNNTSNKLDLKSDIIAEGYCIEANRRWQFLVDDSGSSDRPNDYDTFIIWLNKEELTINPIQDTGYQFQGETGSVTFAPGRVSYGSDLVGANNSPIDRIYNVLHTPARVAARWWKWNGQQVFGLPTIKAQLSFQSGQYFTNFAMAVPDPCGEITDAELSEDSDISEDVTGTYAPGPLVQPIGYEFEVPQLLCDFLDMGLQGKKIIRFRCGSSIFAGYILRAENQPSADNGGTTKFTLIGTETPADVGCAYSSGYSTGYCL
jgi:hypothetical protein